ncbi:hypothetical protein [Anaerosolibacter carboniphilus]|nr:hypothetical protein [Anaerosolibacter carboniphilus]
MGDIIPRIVKEGESMEFIITDTAKKQLMETFQGKKIRIFPKIKT